VCVAGQDLAKYFLLRDGVPEKEAIATSQSAYGVIQTIGGGIGLLSFGPLCARLGRKRSFVLIQIAAFLIVPITCYLPQNYSQLRIMLPIFGFLTLGMHAGYAIYFPELFPTHLRATGAGFCFNVGRAVAASMLFFSGWLKQHIPDIRLSLTLLGFLFLLGLWVIHYLPETKDQPLPE
jgi:MFS family permease